LFENYPISIEDAVEAPEIDGTISDIILYKSLAAGDNTIVEDTTVILNYGG